MDFRGELYVLVCYFLLVISLPQVSYGREWQNLKTYYKLTEQEQLSPKDWLKSDRKQNTEVWKKANDYNLKYQHPEEYTTVIQRLAFYSWYQKRLDAKRIAVNWVKMAMFISDKLSYINRFPYQYFVSQKTRYYTNLGSAVVFNNAFPDLYELENNKADSGISDSDWDLKMLQKEQYNWVASVYRQMDAKSLKQISRIAEGKSIYGFFVPEKLKFSGDLSNADLRYDYAVVILLPYCKSKN